MLNERVVTGTVTFTVHVAVLPFWDFAVIVAVPAPTALTTPFETVATLLFEVVHVMVLLVAFEGSAVAVRVTLPPFVREAEVLLSFTLVTAIVGVGTLTRHDVFMLFDVLA